MSFTTEHTSIKAACHCGQLTAAVDVPTRELPLQVWLCSCDTCRRSSGTLAITCVFLPNDRGEIQYKGEAVRYSTSTGPAGLVRCFCGTCGTFVYDDSEDRSRVGFYAGALTKAEGIVEVKGYLFKKDARDGGIADWLLNIPSYDGDPVQQASYEPTSDPKKHPYGEHLHCRCLCIGVEFWVTRPGPESHIPTPYVNDCIEPGYDPERPPPQTLKWWIRGNGKKYPAFLCMCNDCRQCSGCDIVPWGYVPLPNMIQKDGSPANYSMGTLKHYRSSEGIKRYFCDTCGGKVFFVRDDSQLVNLSLGIADAQTGSRAEEWFAWTHEVCHEELAQNQLLARELHLGLEAWNRRTGKSTLREKKLPDAACLPRS